MHQHLSETEAYINQRHHISLRAMDSLVYCCGIHEENRKMKCDYLYSINMKHGGCLSQSVLQCLMSDFELVFGEI